MTTPGRCKGDVVLAAKGLRKHFGPIQAVEDLCLELRAGELTAIVGDNGAGKSTVVKMLSGALAPDEGSITLCGEPVRFSGPLEARRRGIEVVYQELALAPNLDAVSNIFLGRELTRATFGLPMLQRLDERQMDRLATKEISRLNVKIPKLRGVPVGQMSGGQQESVAIARAAFWMTDVLLMDEPTAALGVRESEAVLELVRQVLSDGVAVAMVSHILPHIIDLADHVVVMRHGHRVADLPRLEVTMEQLVRLIVGAE